MTSSSVTLESDSNLSTAMNEFNEMDHDAEDNCSIEFVDHFVSLDTIKEEIDYDSMEDVCLADRIKKVQQNTKPQFDPKDLVNDICFADCGEFVDPLGEVEENGIEAGQVLIETLDEKIRESYLQEETKISCPFDNCTSQIRFWCIRDHMKVHSVNLGRLACPNCHGRMHITMAHLQRCKQASAKELSCSVTGCETEFDTEANLGQHLSPTHVPTEPCSIQLVQGSESLCPHCGNKFDLDVLSNHIEECANKVDKEFQRKTLITFFQCKADNCNGTFLSELDLFNHVRKVHENVPTKCPRQNCRALVRLSQLDYHIKVVHEAKRNVENCGVSEFRCTVKGCKASFKTAKSLRSHCGRSHQTSTKCPHENCNFYVTPSKLKSHFVSVHGKKLQKSRQRSERQVAKSDLQCTECRRTFETKKLVTKHYRRVHSPPVKCPHENCQVMLKTSSLSRHILEKHGTENRACEKCGEVMPIFHLRGHVRGCSSFGAEVIFSTGEETIQPLLETECFRGT